ncbi:MAG: hypothetical protein JWO15_3564 [Sphingomonadales bacterium]|nr:hypothetical protein [Sphingomonadales bacterium]
MSSSHAEQVTNEQREANLAERCIKLSTAYTDEVAHVAISHLMSSYREEIEAAHKEKAERDFRKYMTIMYLMQLLSMTVGFAAAQWLLPWLKGG